MPNSGSRTSRASSSTGSSSSCTLPAISSFYGADCETSKDVVLLINDVRVSGPDIYRPFIRLLKDCQKGRITRKKLILCVHDLLKGHPFLLSRFCKLVPPELGEEERQPRRVKRIEEKEEDRSKASLDREISIPIDLKSKGPARDTAQPPLGKRETKGAPKSALKRVATKKAPLEVSHPPSSASSGRSWMKPWTLAQHWLCSNRVSDDPALPQEQV